MTKWEYRIIDTKDAPGGGMLKGKTREEIEGYLNQLGEQGWEIVNLNPLELQGRHLAFLGLAKRPQA